MQNIRQVVLRGVINKRNVQNSFTVKVISKEWILQTCWTSIFMAQEVC